MAPASLPRLRRRVPSIVTLIDRHEPEYAEFAEFNLPVSSKVKALSPEAGNCERLKLLPGFFGRSRFSNWKYFALVVALFLAGVYIAWKEFGL
jgi:hypothetical protein